MEISSDTLELLERRLGESVEKRVRGRLFAFYGAAATAFLTAFGYFGYDVVRDFRAGMETTVDAAKTKLDDEVAKFSKTAADIAEAAVAPSIDSAKLAADQAEEAAKSAFLRLSFIEQNAAERAARLSLMEEEINQTVAGIKLRLTALDEKLAALKTKIDDANAQFDEQRKNFNSLFAGAGDLEELRLNLGNDLGLVAEQVALLEERVDELVPGGAVVPNESGQAEISAAQSVAETYKEQAQRVLFYEDMPTVYFQFAGVKREVVNSLSNELAELGYTMPGAERLGSASGLKEVRYFHEDDEGRAHQLANDLNRILEANNYRAELTIEDLTDFKGAKPRLGSLELWLEPIRTR